MTKSSYFCGVLAWISVISSPLIAQGTVSLTNFVGSAAELILYQERLVPAGWLAQLQFSDGTKIGEPASFILNGIFSGGVRTVPGRSGGEEVVLQVLFFSNETDERFVSSPVSVVLGGAGSPPAPPALLSGLGGQTIHLVSSHSLPIPVRRRAMTVRVLDNGLELKWPNDYALFRSQTLNRETVIALSGRRVSGEFLIRRVPFDGPSGFYWLE